MRDAEIMKCAPAPMLSLSRRRRSTPTMTVARALLPLALFALVALCAASVAERPWMNTALPPAQRAQLMLQQMTLDEQLFMLYGHPSDYTGCIPGLPRLGRPNLFFNDGPQGVNRGANGTYTAWPSTMSMSSTWDVDLIKHWGTLMGEEFFLKGVNVALSPGANFARYPGNGRLFEYIASEDPFLGQSLVQPLVSGIQSQNVIATVKHFINNNQDYHRYDIDEVLDERTMMELYMPTFLGAVEAGVGAAMCGYNKVNGLHACEQPQTLLTFKKLGFSGWMMSDWGGTHSTSINQGLDMEMPDGVYMGAPLAAAVAAGNVTVAKVNDSVLRILTPMFAMGQFDKLNPNKGDANVTSVEHSRAARELASKSIILLQNEPALGSVPLPALPIAAYMAAAAQQSSVFRIGVLGRHAHTLPISGGGGSGVTGGPYTISLFSALALRLSINLLPPDCEAQQSTWQQGIEFFDTQPPFDLVKVKDMMACGELCVNTTNCNFFNYYASTSMCKMLMTNEFRMVNADASSGTCRMDGQWQCNEPQGGQQACIALVDGYIGDGFVGDWYEATKLVRESDMTIVSVGMFTKESKDRLTLALEQSQDALIDMARVTSQSKPNVTPIVVVMSSPGAQLTPWRFDISAICVNFGTGQAHGLALVDVLFGDVNPSARLPVTFPNMDNEQRWTPSQYPGVANVSTYSEKLRVGYRWYNQYMVMPAFPFGHGLSYTSFGYSDFILKSMQDGSVMATVTITNTGNYSGVETVQLYVTFPTAADEPPRILKGFQKTAVLAPQQLAVITFRVSSRDLSVWSVDTHDWSAVHGTFVFYAAASSADIRQMQTISISN